MPASAYPVPRSSRPLLRRSCALLGAGLAAVLALTPASGAIAAPSVTTPSSPVPYTEQAPPVLVGEGVAITAGTNFGGGYLDFAVQNGTADEALSLLTVSSPATGEGVVSIVGSTVYLGSGSAADIIGTVDPARTGAAGKLRVLFTSPFVNPSFEQGSGIAGWTAVNDRVDLGVTSIAGFTSIDRSTYAGLNSGNSNAPANDDAAPSSSSYSVKLNTVDASNGTRSLELTSNMTTAGSCDVVHGPAVYSDAFQATAGDEIYFDWRAYQGSDNFHVFGYILNTATGAQTTVLDATGGNAAAPAFQTKATTIPSSGSYRFVFVGGTHDLTCGQAAGARLLIDNVRVYGSKVTNDVVTEIARKLQYANASDDPAATRQIRITAADNGGSTSGAADAIVQITPVDDPPAVASVPSITLTNTEPADTFANTAGTLEVTDPDTTAISHRIVGDRAAPATIDGLTYTHERAGRYGVLHTDEATGRYVFVPDSAAADARTTDDSEEFVFEVSAPDENDVTAAPATARQTLTVNLEVPHGVPGAPAKSSAAAGSESAVVTWSTPTWTSGMPITGYRIEKALDGDDTWTLAIADTGSAATSATVAELTAGVPVRFRVAAINAHGTGGFGPVSELVTPYSTPGAPAIQRIIPSDRALTVYFAEPTVDGGTPITGYEYSVDGGATWFAAPRSESPVTVSGLTNGRPYEVQVRAVNAAGPGAATSSQSATPEVTTVPFTAADGSGGLPAQQPGTASVSTRGSTVALPVSTDGDAQVLTGDGFSLRVLSRNSSGAALAPVSGVLQAVREGSLRVSGAGYRPGTTVDLWLVGSDVLLGKAIVAADGTFDAAVVVPASTALGDHSLQINGLSADGDVRSVAIGLQVAAEAKLAVTGSDPSWAALGLAALLVASGGALVAVKRRRAARGMD